LSFSHRSLASKLNLYGFRRITKGPDAGAYRHEMFHRDHPDRCLQMKRTKQKGSSSPQLRPSPRSGGRPGSVPSSPLMSPESSPATYALEPATLSQSAPTVLTSSMMGGCVYLVSHSVLRNQVFEDMLMLKFCLNFFLQTCSQ